MDEIVAVKLTDSAAETSLQRAFGPYSMDLYDPITVNGEKCTSMLRIDLTELIPAKANSTDCSLGGIFFIMDRVSTSSSYIIGYGVFRIGKSSDTTLRINLKTRFYTTIGSGTPSVTNDDYYNDVPILGDQLYIFSMLGKDSAPGFWHDMTWSFTPSIANSANQTTSSDTSTLSESWGGNGICLSKLNFTVDYYSANAASLTCFRPYFVNDQRSGTKKYQYPMDDTDDEYDLYDMYSDTPSYDCFSVYTWDTLINATVSTNVMNRIIANAFNVDLSGTVKNRLQQIVNSYLNHGSHGLSALNTDIDSHRTVTDAIKTTVDTIDGNVGDSGDGSSSSGNIFQRIKWVVTQVTNLISDLVNDPGPWFATIIKNLISNLGNYNPDSTTTSNVGNWLYDKWIKPTTKPFSDLEEVPIFHKVDTS